jgi:nucleotide-binding universal stress UspA family protein
MTIVCGIDFSERAAQVARVAGTLARRLDEPLWLVHVVDELGTEIATRGVYDPVFDPQRAKLRHQADELRADTGVEAEPILLLGAAHQQLVDVARAAHARLLVVSALGAEHQRRRLLGSVAERVAQSSPVPVLAVRDGRSLLAWARGDEPLRVMVGVDLGPTSKAALRWAAELRAMGSCELIVVQIAWPPEEHGRLGIPGPMPLDHLVSEVQETLERDLRAWASALAGDGETRFVVSPGWGRVDTHLADLAAEANADLLVIGTHQRAGLARTWLGSVSRGVLHNASTNVVCVPRSEASEEEQIIPTFRAILVPTDFSPLANRAILVAYGLVAPGGVVHLLHVITREPSEAPSDPRERLRSLIPRGAASRGVATELDITADKSAWKGIWHAAGRLGVDAVCMATHGRSGASELVLGSQAREVVQRARQPVLLVPPEDR